MKKSFKLFQFIGFTFLLFCATTLQAQISNPRADSAYAGFNNAFITKSGNLTFYRTNLDNLEKDYFWQQALDIQTPQDHFFRLRKTVDKTLITNLLNAFLAQNKSSNTTNVKSWEWNEFNDDLFWATLAFVRGYEYTGNAAFLDQAKYGFNLAYYHTTTGKWGWDDALGGGIWWKKDKLLKSPLSNSPGVIIACYLYEFTGDAEYLKKAKSIYAWTRSHLWDSKTGDVWGELLANGTIDKTVAVFNNGAFGGAANYLYQLTGEVGYFNDAKKTFDRIITNKTRNGILASGSRNGTENAEYIRYLADFARQNYLWNDYYAFLKKNADVAWSMRRKDLNVTWNDWTKQTPIDATWTNECNSGVVIHEVTPVVQNVSDTLQAKNYNYMKGVVSETCSEGGLNIGSVDTGDWMEYILKVPTSGYYTITYRIASVAAGAVAMIQNGEAIDTTNIPNTGGLQTWADVNTVVKLSAGIQSIRLVAVNSGWNIRKWIAVSCQTIKPYLSINGGTWLAESFATVKVGDVLSLKPQPEVGTWSWTGPEGFTSNGRELTLNSIQMNQGGVYTATYTCPDGCYGTLDYIVSLEGCTPTTIEPLIRINSNGDWQQVTTVAATAGDTVLVTPHPVDGTWSWTGPNGFTSDSRELSLKSIQHKQAGTYTATYYNANGCASTMSFTVNVSGNDECGTPVEHFATVNGGAWIQTDSVSLKPGGRLAVGPHPLDGTWEWIGPYGYSKNTREISISNFNKLQAGVYTAFHTNAAGCVSFMDFKISLNGSSALSSETKSEVLIHPNPVKDRVTLSHLQVNTQVRLVDVYGRILLSLKATNSNGELNLDLRELQSGTYFIQLKNKDVQTLKILKN